VYVHPVYVTPRPAAQPETPKKKTTSTGPAEAKVVVDVPSDAVLYIDGQRSKMTSTKRTFVSPVLQPDERYFYDIKAEAVRDGQVRTESRRVVVTAGAVSHVDFTDLGPAVVAETVKAAAAQVTVRLPGDARLFIDGQKCPLTSAVRKFETPKLEPGRKYYYTLKAEIERDGETLVESQRVFVEAGKKISVKFDKLAPATSTASR
jgi:uncharacterized protein (TIGR03000 family)